MRCLMVNDIMKIDISEYNGVSWVPGYRLKCDGCGRECDRLYVDKDDERELCEKCTLETHEIVE